MNKPKTTRRNIYIAAFALSIALIAQLMGLYNLFFNIVHKDYLKSSLFPFLGGILILYVRKKYFEESSLETKFLFYIGFALIISGVGSIIFFFLNSVVLTSLFYVVSIAFIFAALLICIRGLKAYRS